MSRASPLRPEGSGGAWASASLALLDEAPISPASRRLASVRAALGTRHILILGHVPGVIEKSMPDTIVYGVVLFHTSSAALRAEKVLLKHGLSIKMIPTPRQFSSDCGVSLRFNWKDETQVRALLESAQVEMGPIHAMK